MGVFFFLFIFMQFYVKENILYGNEEYKHDIIITDN